MFSKARNLLSTFHGLAVCKNPTSLTTVMESNKSASTSNSTSADAETVEVLHDPKREEFHINFVNCRAFLTYEMEGDILRVLHTEVPKEVGGKGIGKILVQATLKHIEKHKYRAESECDYFRYVVEKYEPKYLKYFNE